MSFLDPWFGRIGVWPMGKKEIPNPYEIVQNYLTHGTVFKSDTAAGDKPQSLRFSGVML